MSLPLRLYLKSINCRRRCSRHPRSHRLVTSPFTTNTKSSASVKPQSPCRTVPFPLLRVTHNAHAKYKDRGRRIGPSKDRSPAASIVHGPCAIQPRMAFSNSWKSPESGQFRPSASMVSHCEHARHHDLVTGILVGRQVQRHAFSIWRQRHPYPQLIRPSALFSAWRFVSKGTALRCITQHLLAEDRLWE
jgi:hypothetical protein